MRTNKNIWEDVDYLDEHGVNLVNLFNRETNEMLIVSEEIVENAIEILHIKVKPEFNDDKTLAEFEILETITKNEYDADHTYQAFLDLIKVLIKA